MGSLSETIDFKALLYALSRQSAPLPIELQQQLTQIARSIHANPNQELAIELDRSIASYQPLEREYQQAIADLQQQYISQERTKSIGTTFPTEIRVDDLFIDRILSSEDWVKTSKEIVSHILTDSSKDSILAKLANAFQSWRTRSKNIDKSAADPIDVGLHQNDRASIGMPVWSAEEQKHRNQLAMEKLQAAIDRDRQKPHSPEAQRFFEEFQQLVDSERPDGQKLFSE